MFSGPADKLMTRTEEDRVPTETSGRAIHYGLLALILVVATVLRVVNLGSQALWGDEGLTLVLAHWPVLDMLLEPTDPTPALYYILHKYLLSADSSVEAIRSISLVCGIASVALMYVFGRLAHGRWTGLLAAALLAVWPQHIDYSQEARTYALLFLLTLASATSLLWWQRQLGKEDGERLDRRRRLALVSFALTTALTFYTHFVAIFWIASAILIFRSIAQSAKPRRMNETAFTLLAMAFLAAPGVFRLFRQMALPTNFSWLRQADPAEFASTTLATFLPLDAPRGATIMLGVGIAQLFFVAIGLALLVQGSREKHRASRTGVDGVVQALTWAFLSLPLLIWVFGFFFRPIFMERTILFAIPGAILAILAASVAAPGRQLGVAFGSLAVVALFVSTLVGGTMRPRENWRGAQSALAQHVRPGDLILFCGWQYPSLRHATQRPVPAPVVHMKADLLEVVEDRLGGRSDWDHLYYRYNVQTETWGAPPLPLRPVRAELKAGARLWYVKSECRGGDSSLASWVEPSKWRTLWASPTTPARAGIEVSRYVLERPLALPLSAPRELSWPPATLR
jgi:4-amino-4-deoxy-L-arabinose transferase-like glycosyltransferase